MRRNQDHFPGPSSASFGVRGVLYYCASAASLRFHGRIGARPGQAIRHPRERKVAALSHRIRPSLSRQEVTSLRCHSFSSSVWFKTFWNHVKCCFVSLNGQNLRTNTIRFIQVMLSPDIHFREECTSWDQRAVLASTQLRFEIYSHDCCCTVPSV